MKIRSLFLLVPAAAAAVTYLTWEPDSGGTTEPVGSDAFLSPAATEHARQIAPDPSAMVDPVPLADATTGRRCERVTHYLPAGDGTVQELIACEPTNPTEAHPYESYTSAALESLAYADPKAAEILGMRLREQDEARAVSLILRSAALSGGDITPILRYSQSYPEPSAIDGVPVRKSIQTQYVLSAVADLLAADTQHAVPWENEIRRFSSDPDREIAMLQARAFEIVAEMRQIELDVTGSSTMGGQGDA